MKVSIVIPTFNRNEMLCRTITNILSFKHQYYELIIVDQTKQHDPKTKTFLQGLIENNKIKYLYIDYPNVPNAMNIGVKEASGDIIFFFDDDVDINENTIPSHISGYSAPDIGCVTGKVIIQNTEQKGNIVLKNTTTLKKIIKSFLFLFLKKKASYVGRLGVLSDYSRDRILPADSCIGCNVSFKKEVFIKCGYFDTNFTGNAVRFETDMSVRLRRIGYKIMYIPQAAIVHYMDNAGGTRTAVSEEYWHTIFRNQCYFYIKNFNYSYINILFIQLFDFLRCKKQGLKPIPILRKAYLEAKDNV
jgi:GT2 family glycosyltransferase